MVTGLDILLMVLGCVPGIVQASVIQLGPTTSPGFMRDEGKLSDPCPDSHPYPLDAGNKCCARWFRTSDISQFIDLYDDASECPANLRIDCPDLENKCKQNTPFFTAADIECPSTHGYALAHGTRCCSHYFRQSDDTTDIVLTDPAAECDAAKIVDCPDQAYRCTNHPDTTVTTDCPNERPVALDNGRHCCAFTWAKQDTTLNAACNFQELAVTDPLECCLHDDSDFCLEGERLCVTQATVAPLLIGNHWTPHNCISSTIDPTSDVIILDGTQGTWPTDTVCWGTTSDFFHIPGNSFAMRVEIQANGYVAEGQAGILFNWEDNDNYEMVFLRFGGSTTAELGYVEDGVYSSQGTFTQPSLSAGVYYALQIVLDDPTDQIHISIDGTLTHSTTYRGIIGQPIAGLGGPLVLNSAATANVFQFRNWVIG